MCPIAASLRWFQPRPIARLYSPLPRLSRSGSFSSIPASACAIKAPYPRLSPFFIHFNRIQFDQYTALAQVERLGLERATCATSCLPTSISTMPAAWRIFPRQLSTMQAEIEAAQDRRLSEPALSSRPVGRGQTLKYYSPEANLGSASSARPRRTAWGDPLNPARRSRGPCRHRHRHAGGLASTRATPTLQARDGLAQATLHPGPACLPMDDGGGSQSPATIKIGCARYRLIAARRAPSVVMRH